MMPSRTHGWWLKAAGGYAAAAVLLWLFLRNTDWTALGTGLRSAGWLLLAAAIVLRLASLVVASLRWQALLEPAGAVPLGGVVAATMMGMTASTLAPMQAAEFVRPYVLSTREGVDFSVTLATTMAEWFLDALTILLLFVPAVAWLYASRGGLPVFVTGPMLLLVAGLSLSGLAALRMLPVWTVALADRLAARRALSARAHERIVGWSRSFAVGLRTLDDRRGILNVGGYSVLLSALTAMSAWLTLTAFDLRLSLAAGFLLLGLVTVAGMIPTPGAIGGFHAVCQLGLTAFFGIDRAQTVLPVIALHGVLYVPGALVGALYFLSWPHRALRSAT